MMNHTNPVGYDRGFFDVFFTAIGVFVTSVTASFVMIGIMMAPARAQNESEYDSDEELPFKQRFYEEFNELEQKELTDEEKEALKDKHLDITTDDGRVILYYNNKDYRFDYWCDNKNINYLELDACAQKYAIDYDCASSVVNYKKEYDSALEKWIESKKKTAEKKDYEGAEEEPLEEEKPESDVFATFKNYNANPINKTEKEKTRAVITTERSNQFKRKGTIEEYLIENDTSAASNDEKSNPVQLSWSEFKSQKHDEDEDKKDK